MNNRRIWFTSDTHYWHKNISGGLSSTWKSGHRNFVDVLDMNYQIIKGINQTVGENDILYHLGDWSFGGIDKIWNFRKQIICKEIHLILGNHDQHIRADKQIEVREDTALFSELCHNTPCSWNSHIVNTRDCFSSVQDMLEVQHGKHSFFLFHYPCLSWHHAHKDVIMLHGHEHSEFNHLNINANRMDVGIDSAKILLGEYRPFSIEEVIEHNRRKTIKKISHHENEGE